MPLVVRALIKTSLAYMAVSLGLAVYLLFSHSSAVGQLHPVFYHLFVVGWLTQLIFGVAWWMFPIASRENPKGNVGLAWAIYGLLNAGLLMRAVAEPMNFVSPNVAWEVMLIVSALVQMIAGWGISVALWPRVKDPRRPKV